ncbi:hypothetical protein IFM89_016973 [Coptis chinensis]|uniref:Retrotransposon gag domain-containing protein n=1 Tax=Coptis chinensis TaxID=261450 RepID=A0A835LZQ3_9MAGN|nr:hypothetical protein IFM89_016973 [Coptis chinensis]
MTVKELEELTGCHNTTLTNHTTAIDNNTTTLTNHTTLLNVLTTNMQRLLAKLDDPNQNSFNPNSSNTNLIQQRQHQQPIIQGRRLRLDFPRFEGEDPESWLFQAKKFFTLNPISEEQKVIMASIHLKGDAIAWYRWLNQSLGELTWRQFSTSLCKRFGSRKHIDPMSSLSKLTQQGTVREYITSFETLINLVPGIQDQHQVSLFVSGLKAEIQAGVRIHNPLSLSHGFASDVRSLASIPVTLCEETLQENYEQQQQEVDAEVVKEEKLISKTLGRSDSLETESGKFLKLHAHGSKVCLLFSSHQKYT